MKKPSLFNLSTICFLTSTFGFAQEFSEKSSDFLKENNSVAYQKVTSNSMENKDLLSFSNTTTSYNGNKQSSTYFSEEKETLVKTDTVVTPAETKDAAKDRFGLIDINGYYDSREATTLTINAFANITSNLSYFGFVNFDQSDFSDNNDDTSTYYSEQNLTYFPFKKIPVGLNMQAVLIGGLKNDDLRFAAQWDVSRTPGIDKFMKKIHLTYGINFHVLNFGYQDDMKFQMEHFYRWDAIPNRVYVSGFMDHTIGNSAAEGIVTEHQIGIRLYDQIHLIGEYRYNEYLPKKNSGFAFGLEYVIQFH